MSLLTTNSTITIHDDADETHCALCGQYKSAMRWGVAFDGRDAVVASEDYEDSHNLAPVCSKCEDKFARGVLQEL